MAIEFNQRSAANEGGADIARQIAAMLKDIRFGSIEVVVHDGRVVQIDKRERFRINPTKETA